MVPRSAPKSKCESRSGKGRTWATEWLSGPQNCCLGHRTVVWATKLLPGLKNCCLGYRTAVWATELLPGPQNSWLGYNFSIYFWMFFFHFLGILRTLNIMLIAFILTTDPFRYHFGSHFGGPGQPTTASISASKMDPDMAPVMGPLLLGVLLTRGPLPEVSRDAFRWPFGHLFWTSFFHFLGILRALNIILIAFILTTDPFRHRFGIHFGGLGQPTNRPKWYPGTLRK